MEKNWVVEYHTWGRYPEDGNSYSCTGSYTEEEAKEMADAINKEEELNHLLKGTSQREDGEYFRAGAVKLGRGKSVKWYQDRIRYMERKLKENKRRGSPDGSSFEMSSDPKAGTFNLGEKLKPLLVKERMLRLPRQSQLR